jgi:hypothetical protein
MLLSNENLANQNMLGGRHPCQYFLCKWKIEDHAIMQFIIPMSQLFLKKKQAAQSRHPEIQEIHT